MTTRAARAEPIASTQSRFAGWLPYAVLIAALLFVLIVRIRLLSMPLERDEGEYAYAGQLLLEGVPPYREAFNMKFPGVYFAYALAMAIFGQTPTGIHLGYLVWNLATVPAMFYLGRRLFGGFAGSIAAAVYAVLSVSPGVLGFQAHATHFVVLAVLCAALLLLRESSRERLAPTLSAGILLGVATLMKQHGMFFILFAAGWIVYERRLVLRRLAAVLLGTAIPLLLTGIGLAASGVLDRFWFWTFDYARQYVGVMSLSAGWQNFTITLPTVIGPYFLVWIIALAGLISIWWKRENRRAAVFVTLLLACSVLAICPGLYFRPHYFVLTLPAIALLAAAGIASMSSFAGLPLAVAIFAATLIFPILQQSDLYFRLTNHQILRRLYSISPFPEAPTIADYIRNHTAPNARIAILASEPEIHFYSHRRGASGYIYMYGMMEPQPYALRMQKEMIESIEAVRPEFVVFSPLSSTWDIRDNSSRYVFDWWSHYSDQHYRKVGVAEVLDPERTVYVWDHLEGYQPKGDPVLIVYRRID